MRENPLVDPEQRRRTKARKEHQQKEKLQRMDKILSGAFHRTFKDSQDSKVVLRYLMDHCGFHQSDIVINPETNEINPLATIHDLARRSLYMRVRSMIDPKFVYDVETYSPIAKEMDRLEPKAEEPNEL